MTQIRWSGDVPLFVLLYLRPNIKIRLCRYLIRPLQNNLFDFARCPFGDEDTDPWTEGSSEYWFNDDVELGFLARRGKKLTFTKNCAMAFLLTYVSGEFFDNDNFVTF